MFATVPTFNDTTSQSEERIIRLDHVEEIKPHANVAVDPGAVDTTCCEVRFYSNTSIIVLQDMTAMKQNLLAWTGTVDEFGTPS